MSQRYESGDRPGTGRTGLIRWVVLLVFVAAGMSVFSTGLTARQAQESAVTAVSFSFSGPAAGLEVELADGTRRGLELREGRILADGSEVGTYPEEGELASEWRELLRSSMDLPSNELADRLRAWSPGPDVDGGDALATALDRMLPEPSQAAGETADTASQEEAGGDAAAADTATPAADTGRPSVTGADGPLTIAPGGLPAVDLEDELDRLRDLVSGLGQEARTAAEDIRFIVHDDYTIGEGRTVSGNLALVDGELRLLGEIDGDALVLDGTLLLESASRVLGDVLAVGGDVRRMGGRVDGEILTIRRSETPPEVAPMERRERSRSTRVRRDARGPIESLLVNVGQAISGLFGVLLFLAVIALVGVLLSYMAGDRLRIVADTTRVSFGRSFLVGILAQILILPVAAMIAAGVITAPLLLLYFPAVALAILAGYMAAALTIGTLMDRKRYPWLERFRRPGRAYELVLGAALLLLPFALAHLLEIFGNAMGALQGFLLFVGVLVTWLAASSGLGAVVLSYAGDRRNYAGPPTGPEGGPPAGGPPGGPAPRGEGPPPAEGRAPAGVERPAGEVRPGDGETGPEGGDTFEGGARGEDRETGGGGERV